MKRIRLPFAPGINVDFADRELALRRVEEWANKGTYPVQVVYGPEGCGKTAWLRQSVELLRELGFDVIYINPTESGARVELSVVDLRERLLALVREATEQGTWGRVAWAIIDIARSAIDARVRKLAIIVDDVFQTIGLDKAALYVKGLLGILEHPPAEYERVITIVATSEGVSLREVGRHNWAEFKPIWNMPREGFKQLYDQIPGGKPPFEDMWQVTGGNPRTLLRLYKNNWNMENTVKELIREKDITPQFTAKWRTWLEKAVEDPDTLWNPDAPEELINELIRMNLILHNLHDRDPWFWVDQPPPEKDLELGIGKYVAWQTPLHREAVRKALESLKADGPSP
ncbi:ATP-binding protein [Caldivirga sp.]|uniref:ATP-binding protein n=1 Tax=Caldivirga sp. TaxID=2080243 RepID=UPI0025C694CA|nr:ATP-binding protein [Caldivirga sp.]